MKQKKIERRWPPSAAAVKLAYLGFRERRPYTSIQREIKIRLGENIIPTKLGLLYDDYCDEVNKKRHLKRKGSEMVEEYLMKAQGGEDVSELQSVLANAVYLDLLRRYAAADEGLEELPVKDMLKIAGEYQRLRLASVKAGVKQKNGLPPREALAMLDALPEMLGLTKQLKERYLERLPLLRETVAAYYDEAAFAAATADHELMQEIQENYERHKSAGGDS